LQEGEPSLQQALHGKLKQGRQKHLAEERVREGTLQEQRGDNLEEMDQVFC